MPVIIAVMGSWIKTNSPIKPKTARKLNAKGMDTAPDAKGRSWVLATARSKSRSHKSLTTQPAPRITIAPIKNSAMM